MSIVLIILVFILKFLLYFFLTLLTLVLLLMILPFTYKVYLGLEDEYTARIKIGWAFGLISLELNFGNGYESKIRFFGIKAIKLNLQSEKETDILEKEKKEKQKEEKPKKENIFTLEYIRELMKMGIIEDFFEFLRKLLNIVLPMKIEIEVHYGMMDPSITGHIHAAYSSIPDLREKWNIFMYPNFVEEDFSIEGFIVGRFQIIFIIILAIKLWFNKTARKILRDMRRSRKNGKQK